MPEPSSSLTVTELLGPDRTPGRELVLQGSGLPLQGAEWAAEQRLATTWYPGNPEATQQVLGPKELPSEWEGVWRLPQLAALPCTFADGGDARPVSDPTALRDILDSLRADGAFLRVTWESQGKSLTRFGRLGRCAFPHDRATDIKWRATFEWTGRGGQRPVVGAQLDNRQAIRLAASQATLVATRIELDALAKVLAADAGDPFTLADLEQFADYPATLGEQIRQVARLVSSKLKEAGDLVVTAALSPTELAASIFGAAEDAISQFSQLAQSFTQIPSNYLAAGSGGVSAVLRASDRAAQVLDAVDAAALALADLMRANRQAGSRASPAEGEPQGPAASDLLATRRCKDGDTFVSLALLFYADPDLAGALARANGLPPYQVAPDPGFILLAPTRAALAKYV